MYVEIGPGAVLSTLVKRIVPGARTMACGTAADVEQLIGARWPHEDRSDGQGRARNGEHARHRARDRVDAGRGGRARGRCPDASAEGAAETAAALGGETHGFAADIADTASAAALVESVEKHFGALDILVNNAGITRDNLLMRLKDDDWDAVLDANLRGAFVDDSRSARAE